MNSSLRMFRRFAQIRSMVTSTPQDADVNSLTCFVYNLPWTVSKRELKQYFAQFGPVAKADVIFDEQTGLSRGYGYVSFSHTKPYVKVLQTERHIIEGKLIEIDQAKHAKKFKSYIDEL